MEKERRGKAKRYARIKTRVFLVKIALSFAAAFAFHFFLTAPVESFAHHLTDNFYLAALAFSTAFFLFLYLAGFALKYYGSYNLEKKFELSERTLKSWAQDEVKKTVLSYLVFLISVSAFFFTLRNFPNTWWVVLSVLWIFFSVVIARILPVVIVPLFFKTAPIEDELLNGRIVDLARDMGVTLNKVLKIDISRKTKKANAALVGMGGSRRVLLADTLTDEFTHEEILCVLAHEFAHHKKDHIWKLLAMSGVLTLAGFFVFSRFFGALAYAQGTPFVWDFALLPLYYIILMVFSLSVLPLQNWFSRVLEREADSIAVSSTADPASLKAVMVKLSDMNLAEDDPPLIKKIFFYDHPPVSERIMFAEDLIKEKDK